jgi:DNA mismatch repair protein MutS
MTSAAKERLEQDNLTPMMRQYLTVKADHPGAIVLFRMGDFFETFFEDAEECSRLLDLTLTARSKEKDIPMAGVPHHAIDGYLAKLCEYGRTVVMVDQVEDPKFAKGLVRREITRILTPGTFLDPNAPARVARYLASTVFAGKTKRARKTPLWGLAVLDLSTGEFRVTSGEDDDLWIEELVRLDARELLVPAESLDDPRIQRLRKEAPRIIITSIAEASKDRSLAALEKVFGADEARGLMTAVDEPAVIAAGMSIAYVEESQLRPEAPDVRGRATLKHVERPKPYVPGDALILDLQAREHLELFRAQNGSREGSLLGAIDRAVTAMGGRLLARWLAYPLRDLDAIRTRQDAIEALIAAPSALDAACDALVQVYDLERLLARVVMGRALPRDVVALRRTLAAAPEVLESSRGIESGSLLMGGPPKSTRLEELGSADPCEDVREAIDAALLDEPSNDLGSGQVFRAGYDADLDSWANLAQNGKGLIAELEAKEKKETGISSLKIRYNKVFGYFIEVTKSNLKLVPARFIRKQTVVNAERFFTEELKELETKVLSAEEKQVARTTELFVALIDRITKEAPRLRRLADALAELDVLTALAQLAQHRAWVRPIVDERSLIEISDGRHPVIELVAEDLGERFVPNDVAISDEQRLLIITGPNMAGKSTIMRQTALIVILAHMGSFVPASSARVGLCDRVFTRVGASDDLSRGRSTFMVEMNETARILRSATSRSLILLDEIGRGTSTFDGLSIAWAVAEYLHDEIGAKTLFATHYHELTEICRDKPRAVNRHVAVKEWNEEIVFLRKLLPGPTNRSYGVQVARLAGLPQQVIDRARSVLDSLEAQALSAGNTSAVEHLVRVRAAKSSEQLFLFAPKEEEDSIERRIADRIAKLDLDGLSPRAALELLASLQADLQKPKKRRT